MALDSTTLRFSAMIREATWARHQGINPKGDEDQAKDDSKGILETLFDGDLHLDDYIAWTAQQYFIYEVIEEAADSYRDHPVAGPFVLDDMTRRDALAADLAFLVGPQWKDTITPLESTARYVARLREVCFDWPGGFIAHQYTRYLGDMSGGQAFRAAANSTFGFNDGPGVSFYVFDKIDDLNAFKENYRQLLDNAPFEDEERQRIINEVLDAYDYNEDFLTALSQNMTRSV